MTSADGKVGIQSYSDNSTNPIRTERTGSLCTVYGHSKYSEIANRGKCMVACNATAGADPGTAFSTAPPIAIWNPPGSGVYLNVIKTGAGYVSGTLGAGDVAYGSVVGQTTTPSGGTEITPNCTLLGSPRGLGRAFTGSTLVATPTPIRSAFCFGAFLGGANPPSMVVDDVEGIISIAPGSVFIIQGATLGAGSAPKVRFSVTWEEVPQ